MLKLVCGYVPKIDFERTIQHCQVTWYWNAPTQQFHALW